MGRTRMEFFRILSMILLLCFLTGCTAGKETEGPEYQIQLDLEEEAYRIAEAAGFETTYNADGDFLENAFGFQENRVSGFKALFGTMIDANRLVLFRAESKSQKEEARKTAEAIKNKLGKSFGDDMPEQKQAADAAVIVEHGNYVLLISGTGWEAGKETFDAMFQPMSEGK